MKLFFTKHLNKLAIAIVAGLMLAVFHQLTDEQDGNFMTNIDVKLAVLNDNLPLMKNDIVSLEEVTFNRPFLIFTMKLNGIMQFEIRKQELIDVERPLLIAEVCSFSKADLRNIKYSKIQFKYIYIDENDITIATIILSPDECNVRG